MAACSGSENKLNRRIIASAQESGMRDVFLDLAEINKGIEKICIQTPYLPRQEMEERAGEQLPGFRELDDTEFALWLFWKNQTPRYIAFSRREVTFRQAPFMACSAGSWVGFEKGQIYLLGERGQEPGQRGGVSVRD
jgi:hypothetical protein